MSTEIIRSIVGRREVQFILQHYEEPQRRDIASAVFITPWTTSTSTYLIRNPEIKTLADLKAKLDSLNIDSDQLLGDIQSLLVLDDDLIPPPSIVDLFLTGQKIAVFTGAGVSSLLGIPRWGKLAESAIEYLRSGYYFSHQECEYLRTQFPNPKEVVSVFHKFANKSGKNSGDFYKECLNVDTSSFDILENPYFHLCKLECVKITSNIEDEFGKAFEKYKNQPSTSHDVSQIGSSQPPKKVDTKRICVGDLAWSEPFELDKDAIYHVHGIIEHPESLVMTSENYVNAYYNKDGNVFSFLKQLFANYTIIFIGYSLSEYDVLAKAMSNEKQHFALIPIHSNQISEFEFQRKYFEPFNISPLPYFLDQSGHDRLTTVLKHWSEYIDRERNKDFLENRAIIEEALRL